jgi:hypothetical protein
MLDKHLDEARRDTIEALQKFLAGNPSIKRAVLIEDLFGKLRVVVWDATETPDARRQESVAALAAALVTAGGAFWGDAIWHGPGTNETEQMVFDRAWSEGRSIGADDRIRVADRWRNRTSWTGKAEAAPWSAVGENAGPPIVVFYSFKGGVGRTTSLASFAIQRARAGERVAVIDLDLDAPGVGALLAADDKGTVAQWGVVDFLLERPVDTVDIRDYYHACRRQGVTGEGEIFVVPAGSMNPDREYLGKLARIDFDGAAADPSHHPLLLLLQQVRSELTPRWILIDARAGLSEPAGWVLGGLAHLHVLFGTSSEQSWQGLRLVLDRIGARRVADGQPQLDCVLVQAMVPEDTQVSMTATADFAMRARDEFEERYYAPDPDNPEDDDLWYVRDAEGSDAPSVPVALSYQPRLAHFARIDDVADSLATSSEHEALAERIAQRFLGLETDHE